MAEISETTSNQAMVHVSAIEVHEAAPTGAKAGGEKKCAIIATVLAFLLGAATIGCGAALIRLQGTADDPVAIPTTVAGPPAGSNPCEGKKPTGAAWDNIQCLKGGVIQAVEQAGADVTVGFTGGLATTSVPIKTPYYQNSMCPVNVHWHLGAEHRSAGHFDETGSGPTMVADDHSHHRQLGGAVRQGLQCHHYDEADAKFTTEYDWKHCEGMKVGQTYEVHWPHSAAGACGTLNQYQTPFYDGVFCSNTAVGLVLDGTLAVPQAIGVQAQVFTIVNEETYYYPDLMRGMIVDGDKGADIAAYTGSTTGTSRDNTVCSQYAPITWQVDRKCHLVSASTFDKMCADMKAQRDDMSSDLHAHGSRELVATSLTASNLDVVTNALSP